MKHSYYTVFLLPILSMLPSSIYALKIPTKAPRSDAPEIFPTIILDQNYYRERDLYLRNLLVTGSLMLNGQQINGGGGSGCDCSLYVLKSGDTMTGNLTFADQHGIVLDALTTGSITIIAPASVSPSYTLELPTTYGGAGQVLTADGNNPAQLSWQPVMAIVTSTIQLYGDVIGSTSATIVKTICGVPACALVNSYSTVLSATSADIPLTLVLRDSTGSFAATALTLTGNLILADLTGALVAHDGLVTATVGIDGTRLASFPSTATPAVTFFQPVEPSRESYFFDDFIAFNASAGAVFYGDTPWVIGNNVYPSRVTSLKSTSSAVGVVRLLTGNGVSSTNYLIKQTNPDGSSNGIGFGLGECINEWRIALPAQTLALLPSFTVICGIGDTIAVPPYTPNNGIYFSYSNSRGPVWYITSVSNGIATTLSTAPPTSPQAGVFQRLAFLINATSSAVDFFIDDAHVGTLYTLPQQHDCSPCCSLVTAGAVGAVDLDYWYYHYTFNVQR